MIDRVMSFRSGDHGDGLVESYIVRVDNVEHEISRDVYDDYAMIDGEYLDTIHIENEIPSKEAIAIYDRAWELIIAFDNETSKEV